jgi:hypothetical protein
MPKIIFHDSEGTDKTVLLGADPVLIGRATECQIQTQDAMVSRRHARITWDGNYWVEDLGSSNGVYVGHERVQKAPFRIGDTVTCGSLVLKMVPDTAPRNTNSQPATGGTPPFGADAMPGVPMAPPPYGAPPPAPPSYGAPPPAPPSYGAPPPAPPSYGAPPPYTPPSAPPPGPPPATVASMATVPPPVAQPASGGGGGVSLADLEAEKKRRMAAEDALLAAEERVKVAESKLMELEAGSKEVNMLRRKVDQMTADMKRLRGGQPIESSDDARFAAEAERDQLRERVADLERRVASSGSSAPVAAAAPVDDGEKDKLRRQVDQLNAEIKRLRTSQGGAAADAQRIAELTGQLAQAQAAASKPGVNPQAADLVVLLGDSLAELRGSLRACNDEAGMLTAPKESVDVIADSLRQAAEQLEQAREKIRQLAKMMGVG